MNKKVIFAEVYQILLNTRKEILEKIPENVIKNLEENRDKSYNIDIDYTKDLLSQDISNDAFGIIAKLYRDYICSDEEREKIKEDEKNYDSKLNSIYSELYSKGTENLFADMKNTQNNVKEVPYVLEEKNWFQKVLLKIKSIFMK